ncbi:hypothetical protein MKX01_013522 [Papaver californicum]|nr:hypothetical protein MKX01_013522 [Papaver californicum]
MDDNSWSLCNVSHSLGSLPDHEFYGSQPEENNNVHMPSKSDPVTNQTSNNLFVQSTYNVPEPAKKRVLMKANKSWKYKKTTLCTISKVARSCIKTPHSTGRKGIPRVEHKMKKESPDGTVDKPVLYMATHVYKNIPDDLLHLKYIAAKEVEKVREIYERDPISSKQKHLDSDIVTSIS